MYNLYSKLIHYIFIMSTLSHSGNLEGQARGPEHEAPISKKLLLGSAVIAALNFAPGAIKDAMAEETAKASSAPAEEHSKGGAQPAELVLNASVTSPELTHGLAVTGKGMYWQAGNLEHKSILSAGFVWEPKKGFELGFGPGFKYEDGSTSIAPYASAGVEYHLGKAEMSSELFGQFYADTAGKHHHGFVGADTDVHIGEHVALGVQLESAVSRHGAFQYLAGGPHAKFKLGPVNTALLFNAGGFHPEAETGSAHEEAGLVPGYMGKWILGANFDLRKSHEHTKPAEVGNAESEQAPEH